MLSPNRNGETNRANRRSRRQHSWRDYGGQRRQNAAQTQANAANTAAQLQYQSGQQALGFQQQVYGNTQAELNPYLQAGYGGLANLQYLLGITPQGNAVQAGTAGTAGPTSPQLTPQQIQQNVAARASGVVPGAAYGVGPASLANRVNNLRDPAFTAKYGLPGDAITGAINGGKVPINGVGAQTSVPAAGAAPGGTPMASLVNPQLGAFGSLSKPWTEQFVAPTGATEQNDPGYQFRLQQGESALQNSAAAKGTLLNGATAKDINAYGQDYASNEYGNVYNRALGEFQDRYNIFQQGQTNLYNRISNLAGLGQISAEQLNSAGQSATGQNAYTNLMTGQQVGNSLNYAALNRASGYGKNGLTGAMSGIGSLGQLLGKAYDQGGDVGDWSGLWNGTGH